MIFVGVDWAEDHHDVCVMAEDGQVLGRRRVPDSVTGIGELHDLVAEHAEDEEPVIVGIEIDRGLIVTALLGAGYEVFAINPLASSRYRDRHAVSGAKSDTGDAKVPADLVRTDRHNHRPVSGDSELVEGIKLLARAHQSAIWGRQRQLNALRSALSSPPNRCRREGQEREGGTKAPRGAGELNVREADRRQRTGSRWRTGDGGATKRRPATGGPWLDPAWSARPVWRCFSVRSRIRPRPRVRSSPPRTR